MKGEQVIIFSSVSPQLPSDQRCRGTHRNVERRRQSGLVSVGPWGVSGHTCSQLGSLSTLTPGAASPADFSYELQKEALLDHCR